MDDAYFNSEEFEELLQRYYLLGDESKEPVYLDVAEFLDVVDFFRADEDFEAALLATERGLLQHPNDRLLMTSRIGVLILKGDYVDAEASLNKLDVIDTDVVLLLKGQLVLARDNNVNLADEYFKMWVSILFWIYENYKKKESIEGVCYESRTFKKPEYMDLIREADTTGIFTPKAEIVDVDQVLCKAIVENAMADEYEESITSPMVLDRIHQAYVQIVCSFMELPKEKNHEKAYLWLLRLLYWFGFSGNNELDEILLNAVDRGDFLQLEEQLLISVLNSSPYIKNGWSLLATTQYRLGKTHEALNSIEFSLAINPDDEEALEIKAVCLADIHRLEDAVKIYEVLCSKRKNWLLMMKLHECYTYMNNPKGLESSIDRMLQYARIGLLRSCKDGSQTAHPEYKIIYHRFLYIAQCYMRANCFEKACETLQIIDSTLLLPYDDEIHLELMRYYDLSSNWTRAIQMAAEILTWMGQKLDRIDKVVDAVAMLYPREAYDALKDAVDLELTSGTAEEEVSAEYHVYTRLASHAINNSEVYNAKRYILKAFQFEKQYLSERFGYVVPEEVTSNDVDTLLDMLKKTLIYFKHSYQQNFTSEKMKGFC